MEVLYVAYDSEPPNLPIAVSRSAQELADKMGIQRSSLLTAISHKKNEKYARIVIDDKEEE